MFLDHPIPPVSEEKRAVGENYTRRRFEIPCRVLCNSFEDSRSMECRSYCEIDEHDRVARVLMSTPRTIRSQLLDAGTAVNESTKTRSVFQKNSDSRTLDYIGELLRAGGRPKDPQERVECFLAFP
jgi:hypothetical protein